MIYIEQNKNKGAAMMLFMLFFTFATSSMMFALGQNIFSDLADFNRLIQSRKAFNASEAITEDVVYRKVFGTFSIDASESLMLDGVTANAITTYDSPSDTFFINSNALVGETIRKSQAEMTVGSGSSFNYGLQAGNGGISLSNSSSIIGNVYSNGFIQGAGSAEIQGDAVSAGPTGIVSDIHITGSVFANTIDNVDADIDAHYNIDFGGSSWGGTAYSPVANQPMVDLPISDTEIQEWKDSVIDHGSVIESTDPECSSGTYTIDSSIATIGYLRIECNVIIKGNGTIVPINGPIWIEGNLDFTQGPELRVDPSSGRYSVQIMVDNPTNHLTSSKISINNSTDFEGSGDDRSYIMLMSFNESASLAGTEKAINVAQSANGDVIVYAADGLIDIGNNIDLREVTAYKINVSNGSSITYESGLASLLFTSGPGGGYVLDDWQQAE